MYFTLTHGAGEDPARQITTEYKDYKTAKRIFHIFSTAIRKTWKKEK